jgi:hypothetical protein
VTLGPGINETAANVLLCSQGSNGDPKCLTYTATLSSSIKVAAPGLLAGAMDSAGLPLKIDLNTVSNKCNASPAGPCVIPDANGGFTFVPTGSLSQSTFTFQAVNSLGVHSATATATVNFPQGGGLSITVLDGVDHSSTISDYRWIIEEDRTFYVDPRCTKNPLPSDCPGASVGIVPQFGTNFHSSYMPVIASGCTGDMSCANKQTVLGQPVQKTQFSFPADIAVCSSVAAGIPCLDPNKRYYISVFPGDAAQPFISGYTGDPDCSPSGASQGMCGHGMGGAPIPATPKGQHDSTQKISVLTVPSPFPPATLSAFVFEDDYPLNGEFDAGGGVDTLSQDEPGLGGFEITLSDQAGGSGDATGVANYDMFNMPLSNSLAGTLDPVTHLDACPISHQISQTSEGGDSTQNGVIGRIITCPTYESDGKTLSPMAGQAVVKNLYAGRYGITAYPSADRIGRGEEWLQTNTLDGQKAHDSFMRIGEPGYFQEYGPAGYHVVIGFANPKIIDDRGKAMCSTPGADCKHEVKGHVTTARMSRTPDQRLYGSGDRTSFGFTQCYVSIGDPDGAEFGFSKCDADGNFDFTSVPAGNWKITTFDQWNDQIVDGITTPVAMCDPQSSLNPNPATSCKALVDMGEVATHQWQTNFNTRTFLDMDGTGIDVDAQGNTKPGLPLIDTNNRFRDGSFSNFNSTDLNGYANFNEIFPLFNWYVIETDSIRFKNTGNHVIYDAGGPVDGSMPLLPGQNPATAKLCSDTGNTNTKLCGTSSIADHMANTYEPNPLPPDLSVPGAVYCTDADCTGMSISRGQVASTNDPSKTSTGRIDPPWVDSYAWQGYLGQNEFVYFGKKPFTEGENGGIHGHVIYASTRPFDDPMFLLQTSWEPLVPHVRINLYQEGVASDGVTPTVTLVDHTETSSFDDWAQGFRSDGIPNMSCPGQGTDATAFADPFFWFTLKDQPEWLDAYNNNGVPSHTLPYNSQFKCYDSMHNWNQVQPAPYDGMYSFPSVTDRDSRSGEPTGTNCNICVPDPDNTDAYRYSTGTNGKWDPAKGGVPMLPDGKYVVEVVVPPGYELVKEEDKNILIGDNYIAPVTQQLAGLGSVFILPDQAEIDEAYNMNNGQNSTNTLGRNPNLPSHESDTGQTETYWPCVGELRTVPDYISLFPDSQQVSPFAGATRPLCDRKEVTLADQTSALTKFYIFTPTHTAGHFTGLITDDFAGEFDPYSPQFGEKFAPAYQPISVKDWKGNEINRVYSDAWGAYNGLNYSTWEVNPPNPTGYAPTMMVMCMNDAGPIVDSDPASSTYSQTVPDPLFQPGYSDFCYELPFMPSQTGYFDTPVVPTSAFAGGYNSPDCNYPEGTPSVAEVDGDGIGPWIAGLKGSIASVNLTSGGSGYTSTPTVTFAAPPAGGTTATGAAVISGKVNTITVNNGGRGYGAAPTVNIANGGGSGTTAVANMTNSVTSVTMGSQGSGYTANPTITFSAPPSGARATGTATRAGGRITSINITNPGSGYTGTATLTISGGNGSGATGTVHMGQSVASVTVTNGGSGYTGTPTVTFAGTATQAASATAHNLYSVSALNIANRGAGYTSNPAVSFSSGGGSGATASASVELGGKLTIAALGDQMVDNYAYSGPSASAAPFNQQKVRRHYGFGSAAPSDFSKFPALVAPKTYNCNSPSDQNAVCPYVTVGGQALIAVSWGDGKITGTISALPASAQNTCKIQQQAIYGGSSASCGELVITAANGQQSVDTVTVTIGGKTPTVLAQGQMIQSAIDSAKPGDLIIVPRGTYSEMLIMWKPVRLQGVGAASSTIDANAQPAGKLDPWRRQMVCLFGLAMNGTPITNANPYDPSDQFSCSSDMNFAVDRIPLEATVGWDATLNGNLAEQLIEPTLMGAYEGAGITVLAKGVKFAAGANPFASDTFPAGTQLLTSSDCLAGGTNLYPGNFLCNPSSIDGLSVKNSSQGGGGIFVHAWNHNLQIANNRVQNNQGTMSGGITIGQGEHPGQYQVNNVANEIPGSCILNIGGLPTNFPLPYCFDMDVNIHNNYVIQNSSLGDELFSSTPAGAGGVTFCNGSDYYKFDYNWVCGNMSTGDGAGVSHVGYSYDGDIEHNTILFNQSTNPTIVTNGGGLLIMGAPDQDPPCNTPPNAPPNDFDCVSAPGSILPSDGAGPGLIVNANLILGNSADSGSGGGLRLQHINGTDVLDFPRGNSRTTWPIVPGHPAHPSFQSLTPWNAVQVTNNIISNNVAGWDGGGVSFLDALAVDFVNNTVVSNNSTASSGVLFQTLFAPIASTLGDNCTTNNGAQSCPQPAGLVSVTNSAVLKANIEEIANGGNLAVICPTGHGTPRSGATPAQCYNYSVPQMYNDLFWQNKAMFIGVGGLGSGSLNQQNVVTIYDATFGKTPVGTGPQSATGSCDDPNAQYSYWDIGVRGDTAPGTHMGGVLSPFYSVLSNPAGTYAESGNGANNLLGPNAVVSTLKGVYCNGSRLPIEAIVSGAAYGWQVPPGTNENNPLPNTPFTLIAGATVDEGNNWINLRWGPMSTNFAINGTQIYNFDPNLQLASKAINAVGSGAGTAYSLAPTTDFFGNTRDLAVDIGAVEAPKPAAPVLNTFSPNSGYRGQSVAVTLSGSFIVSPTSISAGSGITVNNATLVDPNTITATFVIASNAPSGAHNVTVTTAGGTTASVPFTVQIPPVPTVSLITPNSGAQLTSVSVTITGTNFNFSPTVSVSGTGQVTVSNVNVVDAQTITATFAINANATVGQHTVTVSTAGGSATYSLSVTAVAAQPTLNSIAPTSRTRSQVPFQVVLTGSNFVSGAVVNLSGSATGITRGAITMSADGTRIVQEWIMTTSAATGARTVSVTTPAGTTGTVTFTVR